MRVPSTIRFSPSHQRDCKFTNLKETAAQPLNKLSSGWAFDYAYMYLVESYGNQYQDTSSNSDRPGC